MICEDFCNHTDRGNCNCEKWSNQVLVILTRIADSLEKVPNPLMSLSTDTGIVNTLKPCQGCCNAAGKIIKDNDETCDTGDESKVVVKWEHKNNEEI